jgi:GNAT superfamily N-acetyltransferase
VEIRRLGSGDGALLREVRLRALEEAPYAFSSSYAREAALGADFWATRVAQSETATTGAIFVALDAGRCIGMAGGFVREDSPSDATLWGMWVEPAARQHGVGRELLRAVGDWARQAGADRLMLALAQDEASRPAAALYRTLGFRETGESEPLESNPSSIARLMSRALR